MKEVKIQIVDYNLFDYEKQFLCNEIKSAGGIIDVKKIERDTVISVPGLSFKKGLNLTYIKGLYHKGIFHPSTQSIRESFNGRSARTQSRRYGPHGLHEYKGRFNPQTPRSLVLGNFKSDAIILDPFMGSGTTLVEARDLGYKAMGVELNPLAFSIAKVKKIYEEVDSFPSTIIENGKLRQDYYDKETTDYLLKWFPKKQFSQLSYIKSHLDKLSANDKKITEVILSDLLREHSLQNPRDLRIRRRDFVPDNLDLLTSFNSKLEELSHKHSAWIKKFGKRKSNETVIFNNDSRNLSLFIKTKIDGTVCSPPYATALPYVDTYRLSMVAMGLIHPKEIMRKEKELIGARDITLHDKSEYEKNLSSLPNKVQIVIKHIHRKIEQDKKAGFRKKATPYAFARYYSSMLKVLSELHLIEKKGAQNLWVLGSNRVKLLDGWYVMQTPQLIGELAKHAGFKQIALEPIQAYSRYDMHSKNSINQESVLKFLR